MAGNANIGSLFVDLGIDTAAFSDGLKKASSAAGGFGAKFAAIGKSVALAGAAMAASAGAAFVTFGASALSTARELKTFSSISNTSIGDFQRMAAGAVSVGISQEKLADILKDVNDRVGDFLNTGGGPMADFFEKIGPKVGVTAEAFKGLSGKDALQLYVSSLQKAGVNQQEMTFYMEAMASDATALVPLLKDNGAAMKDMGDAAQKAGQVMSDEMVAKLDKIKGQVDQAKGSMSAMATVMGGQMLISMSGMFDQLQPTITRLQELGAKVGEYLRPSLEALGASFSKLASNQAFISFLKIVGTLVGGFLVLNFKLIIDTVNLFAKALDWAFQKIAPMINAIEKLMPKIAAAFKPATDAMNRFTNTAKKMENDVTKNSYVPDMVDEIVRQMQRSDKAFNDSTAVMQRYVDNAKQMAADVRAFDAMSQAERASGAISRADARAARPDFLGNVGALNVKDSPLASTDWIDKWKEGQTKAINDNDQLRSAFANTFSDGLSEALNGNGGNWMKTWFQKTLQNAFQNAMSNLGGSIFDALGKGSGSGGSSGGLGGIFKSVLSFFTKAPGFATGGSFKVGGSGGTDSKYIGMRLTPGEMVNVSKPGNDNGGQLVIPVSLGGEQIETIMVDIATRQATVVTGAAMQGVSTAQARQKTYSRFAR
jgi:uncharacterized protein YoxC